MGVNDDILDAQTSHQIGLMRLSNATVRKVIALVKRSDVRISERLLSGDISELSRTRQEKLLRELRRIIESVYMDATGTLQIELDNLAKYEAQFQSDMLKRVLPVNFETVLPAAETLIAAATATPFQGKLLKEVYTELPAATFRKVRDTIRAGVVEGRTTPQIVRDLRGTKAQGYKDGTLEQSRRAVEAVVRTAVNHTANAASESFYEANTDIIKSIRYNATLDGRTTKRCAGLDGKTFKPGKGPRPPQHFNCRSSTSPVVKSFRELGIDLDEVPASTRSSIDGQVPADLTYDGWLRKRSNTEQDEILGKRKAELFRGGLHMDRFTNRTGDELTLDQLKRKERDVWDKTTA